jgi:hypothetical protein
MAIINALPVVASEKSKEVATRPPNLSATSPRGGRLTGVGAPVGHFGKAGWSVRANAGPVLGGTAFREQATPGRMANLPQRPGAVRKPTGGEGPGRLSRRRAPSGSSLFY